MADSLPRTYQHLLMLVTASEFAVSAKNSASAEMTHADPQSRLGNRSLQSRGTGRAESSECCEFLFSITNLPCTYSNRGAVCGHVRCGYIQGAHNANHPTEIGVSLLIVGHCSEMAFKQVASGTRNLLQTALNLSIPGHGAGALYNVDLLAQ